jgi:hypothetical protein
LIDDKNQIKNQFISSQTFHQTLCVRELENTVRAQFELEELESFDLTTQEQYQDEHLQESSIHWKTKTQLDCSIEVMRIRHSRNRRRPPDSCSLLRAGGHEASAEHCARVQDAHSRRKISGAKRKYR